jgi:hypothetical protein
MQLRRNNCHIRANVFAILLAASGRAMFGNVHTTLPISLMLNAGADAPRCTHMSAPHPFKPVPASTAAL